MNEVNRGRGGKNNQSGDQINLILLNEVSGKLCSKKH